MFSKLKRIGTTAFKVQITVELKRLTILESKDCRSGLLIELERGSKSVKSTPRDAPIGSTDTKLVVQYDEPLTLVMTLYKDSSGKYIEKKGKLILKGFSKVAGKEVKLGSVKLSLHTLADDYEKKNMTLQFEDNKGRPMGVIDVSTVSKYLGDATAGDDDSSVVSGASRSTFSSASHMEVMQGLGGGVAVNPYKRDRIGRFEELQAKATLATKQQSPDARNPFGNNSADNDEDDAEIPLHSAFAAKPSPVVAPKATEHPFVEISLNKGDTPKTDAIKKEATAANGSKDSGNKSSGAKKNEKSYMDSAGELSTHKYPTDSHSYDSKDAEITALRNQLEEARKYQIAMEEEFQKKITSMIERIIEIEDESDLDHYNHEQQTIKILKAAGIYHKAGHNLRDADNNLTYSDDWADLFREQADEERIKVMALKKCLIQFSGELSSEDNQDLLEAGIALTVAKTNRR